ncbi:SDR family NAD(P)-dependent oxidoreductase [Algibacillus agarilyticus]|uniref:SDR family NAD(P)-dependent oxidoreductase n=1 Tax=Algibacillus agarilyticus TaxID=2234133 RepID=UPI000DCFFFA8|nr:SDR family oxidoreductase [Algibacillus agarilyticus]
MCNLAIFGAARGIGLSFIKSDAVKYNKVYLFDISEHVFICRDELISLGINCTAYQLDVTNTDSLVELFKDIFSNCKIDRVCYLIRCKHKPHFLDITPQEWDVEYNLTVKSAFFVIQKIMPYFSDNSPAVLFISSIHAELICLNTSVTISYHSAKAALENMTKYLAVHLGEQNIRVNALRVGFIVQDEFVDKYHSPDNTQYRKRAEFAHPLKRIGLVDEVIPAMRFLLSSDASFITGAILNVDGGLSLVEQSGLMFEVDVNEFG